MTTIDMIQVFSNLAKELRKLNFRSNNELVLTVSSDDLKKIDEDLFYRTVEDKSQEFTPSNDEIKLKFDNLNVIIKK